MLTEDKAPVAPVDVTETDSVPGAAPERKRAEVADVDRSMYDFVKPEAGYERFADGLSGDIVEEISRKKDEPEWMLQMRLKALETYERMEMPKNWGPAIGGLDMSTISTYVASGSKQADSWDEVPDDIKDTFERLGIPEAERTSLAGVGAQYDSEIVYHNMKDEVAKSGVVYTTVEDAMHSGYEDMIREHFGTLIPMTDHKFAALHYAVWSGGSFVYVPVGVKLDFPLQSYFRLNAAGAGQFEHTLIIVEPGADLHFIEGCSAPKYNVANLHAGAVELFVGKGARLRYSTIENWSKNMYNLNTKRVRVEEDGKVEWVSGSFGRPRSPHPRPLPLPQLAARGPARELRVHRHHVRRRHAEPRHGLQGDPRRARHARLGRHQVSLQERRHLDLPQLRRGDEEGRARPRLRELQLAHARRHQPL